MLIEIPDKILEQGCELLDQMNVRLGDFNNERQADLSATFDQLGVGQFLKACVKYQDIKNNGGGCE
tara:strand:- start:414 stop:611 length:198 start_codon:yes stop_codon:yes gene_type:complete